MRIEIQNMEVFYYKDITEGIVALPVEESKHILKVLRKVPGDSILITDGHGKLYDVEIVEGGRQCIVNSKFSSVRESGRNYYLHLAVAPTKMMERYEWLVEKCMEIGIDELTPILCEHSERKIIKEERLANIAVSAMKQSKNLYLPKINPLTPFKEFIKRPIEGNKCIGYCESTSKDYYFNKITDGSNTMLIGPEGDFSKEELNLAFENGYKGVSLGNTILRVETAAIVACNMVAVKNFITE